jgi:hypothetical protein
MRCWVGHNATPDHRQVYVANAVQESVLPWHAYTGPVIVDGIKRIKIEEGKILPYTMTGAHVRTEETAEKSAKDPGAGGSVKSRAAKSNDLPADAG